MSTAAEGRTQVRISPCAGVVPTFIAEIILQYSGTDRSGNRVSEQNSMEIDEAKLAEPNAR